MLLNIHIMLIFDDLLLLVIEADEGDADQSNHKRNYSVILQ
jgi:hypothetical protein